MQVDQDTSNLKGNDFDELYNEKELNKPIKALKVSIRINITSLQDKWKLVPAFLRIRGLVK